MNARDSLYARVFATPDGKRVLDDMAASGPAFKAVAAVVRGRLARARRAWRTGGKAGARLDVPLTPAGAP